MCIMSSPKAPKYEPPPAPSKTPDEAASQSRNRERRRAAAAQGAASTIRTGQLAPPNTTRNVLF